MKKIVLLLVIHLLTTNLFAQTYNLHVEDSGTLIDLVGVNNVENVKELVVSGDLNGTDILAIRKMINLAVLDMSNSNIVSGGVSYYENYTTSENKIGDYFFKEKISLVSIFLPKNITDIGRNAFAGCFNLEGNIIIPNSVITIDRYAFFNCKGLTGILTIPNSVKYINDYAFAGCDNITELSIGDGCDIIYASAFQECYGLKKIIFSKVSSTQINQRVFNSCNNITELNLEGVRNIGSEAFKSCTALTKLNIPNSVTSIGAKAFEGCVGLDEIIIENGNQTLSFSLERKVSGNYIYYSAPETFKDCPLKKLYLGRNISYLKPEGSYVFSSPFGKKTTLQELIIGDSVTEIYNACFSGCDGLTDLSLGKALINLKDNCFSGCNRLRELVIPESVLNIGKSAFYNCSGLSGKLVIPNTVISIGGDAFAGNNIDEIVIEEGESSLSLDDRDGSGNYAYIFSGCPLKKLYLGRNITRSYSHFRTGTLNEVIIGDLVTEIPKSFFWGCYNLTKIEIGKAVSTIGANAFLGCIRLSEITIPESVTSLGNDVFKDCNNLVQINSMNPIPPQITSTTFDGVDKEECILYVPIGCVTTYWLHPYWEEFFNIKEKDFPSTSISNTLSDSGSISIQKIDNGIIINGCNVYDRIYIYSINGQLIYTREVGDGLIDFPFSRGNLYIIKTPLKSLKMIY